MIRHLILIKFKLYLAEGTITDIWRKLREIEGKVPGLLQINSGKSESPEQIERGCVQGFIADFENWEALAQYQQHPDRKKLGARLVEKAMGGLDGIFVFNLPTN